MKVYILYSQHYMEPEILEVESISFSYDAADKLKQELEKSGIGFKYRIQEMDTIDELN